MDIDMIEISKALSNETRLNILLWLKDPEGNFPPQGGCLNEPVDLKGGVCVSSIQAKANLSPSTVSNYLDTLAAYFKGRTRQCRVLPYYISF